MYSEIAHTYIYIWLKKRKIEILYILLMKGLVFGELVGFQYELEFSSIRTYYRYQFTTSAPCGRGCPEADHPDACNERTDFHQLQTGSGFSLVC